MLLEEPEILEAELLLEEEAEATAEAEKDRDSPCLRMGHGSMMGPRDTWWCGREVRPGWA